MNYTCAVCQKSYEGVRPLVMTNDEDEPEIVCPDCATAKILMKAENVELGTESEEDRRPTGTACCRSHRSRRRA